MLTNPVPSWLLSGPRIDSTEGEMSDVDGDANHYITFAMYDDGTKFVRDSTTDMEYQPIHEEGNLFSYPSALAANEGYIPGATLTSPTMWSFGTTHFNSSAAFKEVSAEERQTEAKVERSAVTQMVEVLNHFMVGDNAPSSTPETDNPQKFSKSYSKEEKIGFNLKGRADLVNRGAGNEIAFQAYTGKEGAMTLATAVNLTTTGEQNFLWRDSLYTSKADPALLLPFKFIENGSDFIANTDDKAAMQIRGMRYYLPELLSFSDNRLICGLDYKIHVPVYNASFKAAENFTARLSYAKDNTPTSAKTALDTKTVSLSGWSNDNNNNKGWIVFDVPGSATKDIASGGYYFYVELDTTNAIDEVHEARFASDNTVQDYGGNNTGYVYVYFFNMNNNTNVLGKNRQIRPIRVTVNPDTFTAAASADTDGQNSTTISVGLTINGMTDYSDLYTFLKDQEDTEKRIPLLCEVTYEGDYVIPYARLTGYHIEDSTRKLIEYGGSMSYIPKSEMTEFSHADFAMIPGQTSRFYFMMAPSDMIHPNDEKNTFTYFYISIFGTRIDWNWGKPAVKMFLDYGTLNYVSYLEDVAAESNAAAPSVSADVVTVMESRDFTLTKPSAVYWRISDVKLRGSENTDYVLETNINRTHPVDLAGMNTSFDEDVDMSEVYATFTPEIEPDNEVVVHVSSVTYATKKGVYEVRVQTSPGKIITGDGENDAEEVWTDEATLIFEAGGSSGSTPENGRAVSSSSGGCDSGFGVMAMMLTLGVMFFKRRS